MGSFGKLIFSFYKNKKGSGQPHHNSVPDSAGMCERHSRRQAAGKCKYCERILCTDCLTTKNGQLCCRDKADCLQHLEQPAISKDEQLRKMLKEFAERPNAQTIDDVINLVRNTKDAEITDAICETFDLKCNNLGVYGLAIHCLGLVQDARAVHFLVQCFDFLSNQEALPQDPRLRAICDDHMQRSAQALLNLISTGICQNRAAIQCAEKILESAAVPLEMKKRAHRILLEERTKANR